MSQVWCCCWTFSRYSSEKIPSCCSRMVVLEFFLRKFFCETRKIVYYLCLIYSIQYYRYSSRNMKKLNIAIYMFLHTCITLYSPITYSTQTTILPPLSVYALRAILVNVCFHHAFTIHVLRLHFPMNTVSLLFVDEPLFFFHTQLHGAC